MDGQATNEDITLGASEDISEQTSDVSNDSPEVTEGQTENQENSDNQTEATSEDSTDDVQVDDTVLEHFLESKGISPNGPEITKETLYKLGKMAYNSERQFTRGAQELAELKRQMAANGSNNQAGNSQNVFDMNNEDMAAKFQQDVAAWEAQKKLTEDEEDKMVDWLKTPVGQNPVTGQPILRMHLVMNGVLSLDDVYNASGCGMIKADALRKQMRGEVEKELSARQTAKRPVAGATNSAQFAQKGSNEEAFLKGLLGND